MKHRITAALERFSRAMLAPLTYLSAAGLLLGYKTAERLFELERIEGREEAVERLDDVLFHKIPYISDYI